MAHEKSEALRKKREEVTDNRCKHCGSKKHKTSEHKAKHKLNAEEKEEKEERHVEKEEEKEY